MDKKKLLCAPAPMWILLLVCLCIPITYILAYPVKMLVLKQDVIEVKVEDTAFTTIFYQEIAKKNRFTIDMKLRNIASSTVHGNIIVILYASDGLTELANMTKATGNMFPGDTVSLTFNFPYGRSMVNGTDIIRWDNRTTYS